MIDKAVEFLTEKQPWMTYDEAFALIIDAYERYDDQKKYHGYKTVNTLVDIDVRIYARDEDKAKDRLSVLAEWM